METSDLSIPLCNSMLLKVGSEDEINMKRTEMGIYDYLYNEMSYVPRHRITTRSIKEGLRLSAPDVDPFYYPSNHHGVWDFIGANMYDSTIERVVTVYLRLIYMHPSNDAISKLSCIQRNSPYILAASYSSRMQNHCTSVMK